MRRYKIKSIRYLTNSTFVLRTEKKGMDFETGQFIILRRPGTIDQREYTIYSGEQDPFLEVLVREITKGKVTPRLKNLSVGDELEIDGPFGFFRFHPQMFTQKKFLFMATGTGISPFHSFVRTYPGLDYKLVHGVRYANEAYDHEKFDSRKITLCTSSDNTGDYKGRVTDYIKNQEIDRQTNCFLCGNSEMIHDAYDILSEKGIEEQKIFTEVYF